MENLPFNVKLNKTTPVFNESSVPSGILGRHTTAEGVWGRIVVSDGQLTYRILEPNVEEHVLDTDHVGIVAPQKAHQVVLSGPVKFYIEFLRDSSV